MTCVQDCIERVQQETRCEHLEPVMRALVAAMEPSEIDVPVCKEVHRANGIMVLTCSLECMCKNLSKDSVVCAQLVLRALFVVVVSEDADGGRKVEPVIAKMLTHSILAFLHWANAHPLEEQSVQSAVYLLLAMLDEDVTNTRQVAAGGGASLCLDLMLQIPDKKNALCRLLCLLFEEGADANASKKKGFVCTELRRGTPQRMVECVLQMERMPSTMDSERGLRNLYVALNVVADCDPGVHALHRTKLWAGIVEKACEARSSLHLDIAVIMLSAKLLMWDEAIAASLFSCMQPFCDRIVALCREQAEDTRLQVASVSIFKVLAQARVKQVHECSDTFAAHEPWVTDGQVVPFVRSVMKRQDLGEASSGVMLTLLRQLYHLHGRKWAVGCNGGIAELVELLHGQNPAHDLLSAICALFALTRHSFMNSTCFVELDGMRTVIDLCCQKKVHDDTVRLVCELLQINITSNAVRKRFVLDGGLEFVQQAFRQVGATWGPVTLLLKLLCMSTFPWVPQMLKCGLFTTIVQVCDRRDLKSENAFGLLVFMQWVCSHPASVDEAQRLQVRQVALGLMRRFPDDKNVPEMTMLLMCSMYAIQPWAIAGSEFGELVLRPKTNPSSRRAVEKGLKFALLVARTETPSANTESLWVEVLAKLAKLTSGDAHLYGMSYPVLVLAAEIVPKHVGVRGLKHVRVIVAAFAKHDDQEPLISLRSRLFGKLKAWVLECDERERAQARLAEDMFATLMRDEAAAKLPAQPHVKTRKRDKRRHKQTAASVREHTTVVLSTEKPAAAPGTAVAAAVALPRASAAAPSTDMECIVCMEREKTHALVPCFHMCVCAKCADDVVQTRGACPLCSCSTARAQRVFV